MSSHVLSLRYMIVCHIVAKNVVVALVKIAIIPHHQPEFRKNLFILKSFYIIYKWRKE
jgi:hypothetical protein